MALFKDKHAQEMANSAKLVAWIATGVAAVATAASGINLFTKAPKKTVKIVAAETAGLRDTVVALRDANNDVVDEVKTIKAETSELKTKVTAVESDVLKLKTEVTEDQAKAFADALRKLKVNPKP